MKVLTKKIEYNTNEEYTNILHQINDEGINKELPHPRVWQIKDFDDLLKQETESCQVFGWLGILEIYQKEANHQSLPCPVGFILARDQFETVEVLNIAVKAKYQGRGIGYALLQKLVECCKKNNKTGIMLEVAVNNFSAIELYRRQGFKVISTRKSYYQLINPPGNNASHNREESNHRCLQNNYKSTIFVDALIMFLELC